MQVMNEKKSEFISPEHGKIKQMSCILQPEQK
jgi:hypothetical protein